MLSLEDQQFKTKLKYPEKMSDKVKFYMVLGNHDYGYNIDLTNNSQVQVDYGIQSQKGYEMVYAFKILYV